MVMTFTERTDALLDDSLAALRGAEHPADRTRAVGVLFEGLRGLRGAGGGQAWRSVAPRIVEHPVRELLHEDPMTRRSFEKPRGYAGDAVLLDYIYQETDLEQVSSTGRAVNGYATMRPAACAVRHRRDYIAYQIDRACDGAGPAGGRVLSVACGHLREAQLSAAVRSGALGELVALDADAQSLALVDRAGLDNVRTLELSIGRLLAGRKRLGRFDLVYSAGLYDYLDDGLAERLTTRLFDCLEPGGRLLLSNFLPGVSDAGYMETFMGWELLLRDLEDIRCFGAGVDMDEVDSWRVFEDPFGAIGYLEMVRRG
jgi:extracellular factor (EF) 3-hydroxypalmitic acid methyl ester biosynthesis protein